MDKFSFEFSCIDGDHYVMHVYKHDLNGYRAVHMTVTGSWSQLTRHAKKIQFPKIKA